MMFASAELTDKVEVILEKVQGRSSFSNLWVNYQDLWKNPWGIYFQKSLQILQKVPGMFKEV